MSPCCFFNLECRSCNFWGPCLCCFTALALRLHNLWVVFLRKSRRMTLFWVELHFYIRLCGLVLHWTRTQNCMIFQRSLKSRVGLPLSLSLDELTFIIWYAGWILGPSLSVYYTAHAWECSIHASLSLNFHASKCQTVFLSWGCILKLDSTKCPHKLVFMVHDLD